WSDPPPLEPGPAPREERQEPRMSSGEMEEVESHMQALDDHALLRLVTVEQREYRPEAIATACAELRRRGLAKPTREEYWTRFPSEKIGPDGFCAGCRAATTDESPW